MKNFKKVLSLVLALSLLVSTMTISFAAADTTAEKADVLNALGLLNGVSTEEFDPALDVEANRQTAMVLLARAFGWELDDEATTDFEDVADWAVPAVAKAVELGVTNGMSETEYGALEMVTARQVATWVARLLTGSETAWEDNADLDNEESVTRGGLVDVIWETLSQTPVGAEKSLIETIIGDDADLLAVAQEAGLVEVPVVPTELAVKSVTADNLKTLTIEFNQEIDKDTVKAATVKVVEGTTDRVAVLDVTADKMAVVVTLNTVDQSDSLKVTVEGVKNAAGEEVVKYEETLIVNDVTVPTVVGAVALNPKQIKVTFSEAVQAPAGSSATVFAMLNDIKVGGSSIVAKAAVNNLDKTILFTLSTALTEGSKTIEVKGIKDYANFTAPTVALTFEVAADTVAPVATEIVVKSMSSLVVKFSEPVETAGTFKIDNGSEVAANSWNDQKTEATFTGLNLGISAIVEVKVQYKGQKDIMGNEVKDWATITTKVADDSTLPTVELTSVGVANKLTLTFSKTMQAVGKLQILDKDDKVVQEATVASVGFKANTDSKVIEWTVLADKNPGDYKVKITDMKDATVRQNGLATATLTFTSLDTLKPTVSDKFLVTAGVVVGTETASDAAKKDTVKIYFSEAMDKATIENLANYQVKVGAGVFGPLQADANATKIAAASDLKSVTITYTGAAAATLEFKAVAVKDAAGNMIDGAISAAITKQANTYLNVSGNINVVSNNTIEVTFTNAIASVDPSVFVVYNGTDAVTGMASAALKAGTTNTVVFTTAVNLDADAYKYTLKVNAATAITNVYGKTLTKDAIETAFVGADTLAVVDQVKPTLVKVEKGAVPNSIKFTFSENLKQADAPTVAALKAGLVVKNSDGVVVLANANASTVVVGNDKTVLVTFAGADLTAIKAIGTNVDAEKTIKVSFPVAAGIGDNAATANGILPIADQEVKVLVDTTPVAYAKTAQTGFTSVTLVASEALYIGGTAVVNGQDIKGEFTYVDAADADASVTSAIYNSTTRAIVFTIVSGNVGDTIAAKATLTDEAGNASATTTIVTAGATAW